MIDPVWKPIFKPLCEAYGAPALQGSMESVMDSSGDVSDFSFPISDLGFQISEFGFQVPCSIANVWV